jgi:hypothetical protein
MIYRQRDTQAVSAWISDKSGAYTHGRETVCPGFHLYRGFVGCPAWAAGQPCDYCYLKTTFRTDEELRKGVAWVDSCGDTSPPYQCRVGQPGCSGADCLALTINNARAAVEKWVQTGIDPYLRPHVTRRTRSDGVALSGSMMVLNAGELADTLGFPPHDNPHVGMLLDAFSNPATNPYGHKLLFVTKAGLEGTRAHLEGREPSENVILSWSVGNMGANAEPHWLPAFVPGSRLVAAARMLQDGWRVRLRIDPLGPGHDWQADVKQYVRTIRADFGVSKNVPELITLGTLRHKGGRVKLPAEERASIYREAITGLREGGYTSPIGLCKETPEMIDLVLGLEPEAMKCNCIP